MTGLFQRMRNAAFILATCNGLGNRIGGALFASFLAFPLLIIGKSLFHIAPKFGILFWVMVWTFALIAIQSFLQNITPEERVTIVLDKALGLSLAFLGITLSLNSWRCILAGIICFHFLRLLNPLFLLNKHFYRVVMMSNAFGIIAGSALFGLLTNIILRIYLWY